MNASGGDNQKKNNRETQQLRQMNGKQEDGASDVKKQQPSFNRNGKKTR